MTAILQWEVHRSEEKYLAESQFRMGELGCVVNENYVSFID